MAAIDIVDAHLDGGAAEPGPHDPGAAPAAGTQCPTAPSPFRRE